MRCTRLVSRVWAMALLAAWCGARADAGQADFAREWNAPRSIRPAVVPSPASIAREFSVEALRGTSGRATRALDADTLVRKDATKHAADFARQSFHDPRDRVRDSDAAMRAAAEANRTLAKFAADADRDRDAAMRAAAEAGRTLDKFAAEAHRGEDMARRAAADANRTLDKFAAEAQRSMERMARDHEFRAPAIPAPMPMPRFDVGGPSLHGSWGSW